MKEREDVDKAEKEEQVKQAPKAPETTGKAGETKTGVNEEPAAPLGEEPMRHHQPLDDNTTPTRPAIQP